MKKVVLLLSVIAMALTLGSCYDFLDTRLQMIAYGLAIDKEDDAYHISVEVIKTAGESSEENKTGSVIYKAQGGNVYLAMNNLYQSADKMFYWGHLEVVIISERVVEQEFLGLVDILTREPQIYLNTRLLICKENSEQFLQAGVRQGNIATAGLKDILETNTLLGRRKTSHIWQINRLMDYENYTVSLPYVAIGEGEEPAIAGTAIIKGGRLLKVLDESQTQNLLFLHDDLKGGYLTTFEIEPQIRTSLEIIKNNCGMEYSIKGGQGRARYKIITFVSVFEMSREYDLKNPENRRRIERLAAEQIEHELREFIRQNPEDIYGYSQKIAQKYPRENPEDIRGIANKTQIEFDIKVVLSESRMMM